MRRSYIISALINLIVGLAVLTLALRIVFRLFAANPSAPFVHWIYVNSTTLLAPFRGIFPSSVIDKSYVLDFSALFALIVYVIIGSFLIYLANSLEETLASLSSKKVKKT